VRGPGVRVTTFFWQLFLVVSFDVVGWCCVCGFVVVAAVVVDVVVCVRCVVALLLSHCCLGAIEAVCVY